MNKLTKQDILNHQQEKNNMLKEIKNLEEKTRTNISPELRKSGEIKK